MTEFLQTVRTTLDELHSQETYEGLHYQLMHMRDILERWKIVGLNRKLQIKPRKFEEYTDENGETKERCTDVQLILKWGGNLTKLGEKQSISLGQRLRHEMVRTDGYVRIIAFSVLARSHLLSIFFFFPFPVSR
jgi:inositol hexakisphosphate/diphosphoinositol-pentakisphosphate kinase